MWGRKTVDCSQVKNPPNYDPVRDQTLNLLVDKPPCFKCHYLDALGYCNTQKTTLVDSLKINMLHHLAYGQLLKITMLRRGEMDTPSPHTISRLLIKMSCLHFRWLVTRLQTSSNARHVQYAVHLITKPNLTLL